MSEAVCGIEITRLDSSGGTLGCFLVGNFYRCGERVTVLLTNRHVLKGKDPRNQNVLNAKTNEAAQEVLRDSFLTSAAERAKFYTLIKGKEIPLLAWYNRWNNPKATSDDFAVAALHPEVSYKNQADGTALHGIKEPEEGLEVWKVGATTGCTKGRIVEISDKQFVVQGEDGPFAAKGDSGSAIYTKGGEVVGLLFGFGGSGDIRRMQQQEEDASSAAAAAAPAAAAPVRALHRNSAYRISYVISTLNTNFPNSNVGLAPSTGKQLPWQK